MTPGNHCKKGHNFTEVHFRVMYSCLQRRGQIFIAMYEKVEQNKVLK